MIGLRTQVDETSSEHRSNAIEVLEPHGIIKRSLDDMAGRAVPLVEDGDAAGMVLDVKGVLASLGRPAVQADRPDLRLDGEQLPFVARPPQECDRPAILTLGYDQWFVSGDLDEVPAFRKVSDPDNVVRLLFDACKTRAD